MKEIYKLAEKNNENNLIFPANKKSSTYYDTIYCFHPLADEPQYATDLSVQKIFHQEKLMDDAEYMTFFVDDDLVFKSQSGLDLTNVQ